MTKELRAIFKKVGEDSYGPKPTNPVYEVVTPDGRVWKVERHKWELPVGRWGWVAKHRPVPGVTVTVHPRGPVGNMVFADTLDELARWELGIPMLDA